MGQIAGLLTIRVSWWVVGIMAFLASMSMVWLVRWEKKN
jgi:hypothetical protein